jgi:hypothetical protein
MNLSLPQIFFWIPGLFISTLWWTYLFHKQTQHVQTQIHLTSFCLSDNLSSVICNFSLFLPHLSREHSKCSPFLCS